MVEFLMLCVCWYIANGIFKMSYRSHAIRKNVASQRLREVDQRAQGMREEQDEMLFVKSLDEEFHLAFIAPAEEICERIDREVDPPTPPAVPAPRTPRSYSRENRYAFPSDEGLRDDMVEVSYRDLKNVVREMKRQKQTIEVLQKENLELVKNIAAGMYNQTASRQKWG